jgi:micrococcal nuclease
MYEYKIKQVIKVVDGDTIDVEIDLGFDISIMKRVRLAGIDTPESRTTDKFEKSLGLESKARLKQLLSDAKLIVIKTEKPNSTEKFGRVLGWLYIDDTKISINDTLIASGYAWSYLGDTKVKNFDELIQKRKINDSLS